MSPALSPPVSLFAQAAPAGGADPGATGFPLEGALALLGLLAALAGIVALLLALRSKASGRDGGPWIAEVGAMREALGALQAAHGAVRSEVSAVATKVGALETKIVETTGGTERTLLGRLHALDQSLASLRAAHEERRAREERFANSLSRVESIVAGTTAKGAAGENILYEALRQFPSDMVETNFRVGGKPVEFALVLGNGKRLPIDSKWPATDLLQTLAREEDPDRRDALVAEVEKATLARVREVSRYLDAETTTPFAIAAVPDSVFAHCRKAHAEANRERVLLMPYGVALPVLLGLWRLAAQSDRSVEVERLESCLGEVEASLRTIEDALENKIARAGTMTTNAYGECRIAVSRIRSTLASLRVPSEASAPDSAESAAPEVLRK